MALQPGQAEVGRSQAQFEDRLIAQCTGWSTLMCRPGGPSPGHWRALSTFVASSPRGDQPGARTEGHATLVAVVRRERFAQALDRTSGLAFAQGREGGCRVLKPADERERGVEVVSVEDRLVDVLEARAVEPGALEDAPGGFGITWASPSSYRTLSSRSAAVT